MPLAIFIYQLRQYISEMLPLLFTRPNGKVLALTAGSQGRTTSFQVKQALFVVHFVFHNHENMTSAFCT